MRKEHSSRKTLKSEVGFEFWWSFLSGNVWMINSGSRLSALEKDRSIVKRETETPYLNRFS